MKPTTRTIFAGIYGVLAFLVALTLSWAIMLKFDFFYGVWHDHGGIKEGIEKFGPKNRYKQGFADTTRAERLEIFSEISIAIHNNGKGLDAITYISPTSGGEQILLREPEVIHLQDVAHLLNILMIIMAFVFFAWPTLAVFYYKKQGMLPEFKIQLLGLFGFFVLLGAVLLVFGPENVFNTLHVWVFPDDHQWFFYYQESLMSTMMLAPRLFAWIAGAWAILSVVVFLLLNALVYKGVNARTTSL